MTNTVEDLNEQLDANRKALATANSNAALFAAIQAAPGEVPRLQKEGERLTAALSRAMDAEAKAEVRRFASQFRNIKITVAPHKDRAGIINSTVTVHYERLSYNSSSHENEWGAKSGELRAIDRDFLDYIVCHRPDLIPADIMAFQQGDAPLAVRKYLDAVARGYVRT